MEKEHQREEKKHIQKSHIDLHDHLAEKSRNINCHRNISEA
jgi:hypothetical protein